MWLGGSEAVHLYLGMSCVGVQQASAEVGWADVKQPQHAARVGIDNISVTGVGRARLHVSVSGAFARPFLIGPMTGLRRWSEAERVIEAMAPEATGLDQPCVVQVCGNPTVETCVAVAMPSALLSTLRVEARKRGLSLRSISPWWSSVLNTVIAREPMPAMLVVGDADSLTVLRSGAACGFAAAATCFPRPPREQLAAWLTRQAVVHGVDANQTLYCEMKRQGGDSSLASSLDVPFGAVLQAWV